MAAVTCITGALFELQFGDFFLRPATRCDGTAWGEDDDTQRPHPLEKNPIQTLAFLRFLLKGALEMAAAITNPPPAEAPPSRGRLERQGAGRLQPGGAGGGSSAPALTYTGPSPPPSPPPTPPPSPPSAMVPYQAPSGEIVPYKTDVPSELEARRGEEARRERLASNANAPAQTAGASRRHSNAEQRCGVWKYPEVAGTPPKPRFSHSASHVSNLL